MSQDIRLHLEQIARDIAAATAGDADRIGTLSDNELVTYITDSYQ